MDNNLVHTHIDSNGKEYTHSHAHPNKGCYKQTF